MANLTTTGTTSYPGAIDTRTALTDGASGDQVVSSHPNGLGAGLIAVQTELGVDPAGSVADVATRLGVALNNDGTVRSSVIAAGGGTAVNYSAGVFTISWSPDGPSYTQNLGIEVTANAPVANAMRIRLVQRSGATPTSASPARLAFAVATASAAPANAAYVVREITSDTALVFSVGSSLGTFVNETARIYMGALDNNGTVEALAYNPKEISAATESAVRVMNLFRPSEVATYTTVAEGGAGGADSAATLYSTSGRTGVYIRRLGYLDITLGSTLGNWANNPNRLVMIGAGVPQTGDVINAVATSSYGVVRTTTTTINADGTIPQIGEGAPGLWATMTHTSVVNPVRFSSQSILANNTAGYNVGLHIHRNSEANALLAALEWNTSADQAIYLSLDGMVATTTNGATGYYLLFGGAANTTTFNGVSGASRFGASSGTFFKVEEVCA